MRRCLTILLALFLGACQHDGEARQFLYCHQACAPNPVLKVENNSCYCAVSAATDAGRR